MEPTQRAPVPSRPLRIPPSHRQGKKAASRAKRRRERGSDCEEQRRQTRRSSASDSPGTPPGSSDGELRKPVWPRDIFRAVNYSEEGYVGAFPRRAMPPSTDIITPREKALVFILRPYEIPDNFERPVPLGPISGSSFAERVIVAFMKGCLKVKIPTTHEPNAYEFVSGERMQEKVEALVSLGYSKLESSRLLTSVSGDLEAALTLLRE